jgi:hypothetical protein
MAGQEDRDIRPDEDKSNIIKQQHLEQQLTSYAAACRVFLSFKQHFGFDFAD